MKNYRITHLSSVRTAEGVQLLAEVRLGNRAPAVECGAPCTDTPRSVNTHTAWRACWTSQISDRGRLDTSEGQSLIWQSPPLHPDRGPWTGLAYALREARQALRTLDAERERRDVLEAEIRGASAALESEVEP